MICQKLGIPFTKATCADELSDYDRYVAIALTQAERIYREEEEKKKK